ncbi:Rv3235 family protein [Actinophytocola sediminis]
MHEPSPGGVVLYSLPDYEPTHAPGEPGPPRRWSSLRPARGPQLTLVAPPNEPAPPDPGVLWRLVVHLLEVLDGRRGVHQLRAMLSDTAYEALLTRLRVTPPGRRHKLRKVHSCLPAPDVVELSAVFEIVDGGPSARRPRRVRAAAIRLEKVKDRWHCAVLRIL